jgi:hypothetical protein
MEEPTEPTWAHSDSLQYDDPRWQADDKCRSVFRWMCGGAAVSHRPPAIAESASAPTVQLLLDTLQVAEEPARTDAAFQLGATGVAAVGPLIDALRKEALEPPD